MSKSSFSLLIIFSLVVFLGVSFFAFSKQQKVSMVSPVLGAAKIKLADNLWFPKQSPNSFTNAPEITADSAFFVDTNTGEVLYDKNSHQKLRVASLTKIMTVILAMNNKKLDDTFYVSEHAANMDPDKMLLIAGERLSLEELIEGIFLVSANDAAEVLAENIASSRDEFIKLMNEQATALGMKDSLFINPSGLEEDDSTTNSGLKEQHSSAFDISLMSRYAIKTWPKLVDISSKDHIILPQTSTHQDYDMYSGINLLTTYPGVVGFKTGYTPEAGLTLVTLARRGDKEVLGVILGATDRRDDAKMLLDYSFKKLGL